MTDWVDKGIADAIAAVTCGIDTGKAEETIRWLQEALQKQAQALREATYDTGKTEANAKVAAHTAKALDGFLRMTQFARGQPDSRPDLGGDWLKALTDEQLEQVQQWVQMNRGDDGAEEPERAEADRSGAV